MHDTRKKPTPPGRENPDCYCVTNAQGFVLHRMDPLPGANPLQLKHFVALEHFLTTTERLDRLQAMLTEWLVEHISQNFGTWEYELEDLGDMGQLLDFLSRCHRQPTPTELENSLNTEH